MKEITNKDVCIVIPIYKDNINNKLIEYEIDSIRNTIRLMKNYDIYFLCNENLNTLWYKKIKSNSQQNIYFKYYNFKNREEYINMCLDYKFYKIFYNYDYMLICQTDVWIFKDELLYWCNKGYDYIGAPNNVQNEGLNELFIKTHINHNCNDININEDILHYNGGFSLRNIKSFYKICFEKESFIKSYPNTFISSHEDLFICYVLKTYLNFPSFKEAGMFSLEQFFNKNIYYKYFRNDLPFGCHGINCKLFITNNYK